MQNIINLLVKYGTHFLFALLQIVCFYLIVNYNQAQKSIFLNSSKIYNNKIVSRLDNLNSFLSLKEVNDSLALYNAQLLEQYINQTTSPIKEDSIRLGSAVDKYHIIPANVVSKTTHLRNNHLTLDRGKKAGVRLDMGVISKNGVVGIVRNTSDHFSHVVSILNSQLKLSATVKGYAYPGTINWVSSDTRSVNLASIPKHANIAIGDTVITNGYSTIFPAGIPIGIIEDFKVNKGSSNYSISVQLSNDPSNVASVYILDNTLAAEQHQLEAEVYE